MSTKAPKLPVAEIPNSQIAGVGREFRQTVDFLYHHIREVNCLTPLLMMAAFGMELFLKCLNAKSVYEQEEMSASTFRVTAEAMKKGHRLVALFDNLDLIFQHELETSYKERPINEKKSFRELLPTFDSLFEDVRYEFEDGEGRSYDLEELVGLLRVIGDHVGSLKKRVYFEQR